MGVVIWLEPGGSGAKGMEREPRRRQVTLPSTARGPWFPTHGAPGLGLEAGYGARTQGQLGFLANKRNCDRRVSVSTGSLPADLQTHLHVETQLLSQGQPRTRPCALPTLAAAERGCVGPEPDPKYCRLSAISYGRMGAGTAQRPWSGCGLYTWAMDSRSMGKTHNKKIEPL